MGKLKVTKHYLNDRTWDRIEKIEANVQEKLLDAGHAVTRDLIEDIAVIILKREDNAFYKDDYGKL